MANLAKTTTDIGRRGEAIAAEYVRQLGYNIIFQNYHCRFGELDIVCLYNTELIFIEVKTRTTASGGAPELMVTPRKLEKLTVTIQHFLGDNKIEHATERLDIIAIYLPSNDGQPKINHLQNIIKEEESLANCFARDSNGF